jgi:hypothetical protein
VKADRELDRFLLAIHGAAETAVTLSALRARRGRAGGLARARTAWRHPDGTFMPKSEKWEAYRDDYERQAAGGRARAAGAERYRDGTFAPKRLAGE